MGAATETQSSWRSIHRRNSAAVLSFSRVSWSPHFVVSGDGDSNRKDVNMLLADGSAEYAFVSDEDNAESRYSCGTGTRRLSSWRVMWSSKIWFDDLVSRRL